MEYKNTKTGVVIDVASKISGGNWVPYSEKPAKKVIKKQQPVIKEPVEETDSEDIAGVTKEQIKHELDAFGIKYDPNAKKQVLYDLMMKGK